jgi:NAD(P)-dependent dehydrogenase (short-subunit alcohol dehydrogenase family)
MHIEGRTFLVSGGASGLGGATARMLVGAGGQVVILDLNAEAGEKAAADLGSRARFAEADVSRAADVQRALEVAREAFGDLHGAVNAAGVLFPEKVLGRKGPHRLETFEKTVGVNLVGTFNVMRLAAEAMAAGEPADGGARGVIVCTASVAAYDGQIGQAAYAASKGGVVSLTLPVARELARYGIRVVTIAPGIFDTPMLAGLSDAARASLGEQVPFPPRLGRPEEYAALVRHIIENEVLNGEVIRLDGALRMAAK